ncbi:MAG TPA: deaminase [Sumerlaeia bacterium]|nr:deaminase [Sumerlaeia bacterium]
MIVGVTGYFCAGKDTFANFVAQKGFKHVSLSDMIREEIHRRGERVTIPRLTGVGNELRADFGPQVLAQRALETLPRTGNAVVTSIRHSAEVEMLRTRRGFVMIFIDAPLRVRYERSQARGRKGDPVAFEDFRASERAQMRSKDPSGQQLLACKKMADIVIHNNGSPETFQKKITDALKRVFREFAPARPTWDEYFMCIAEVAASRANCIKRHIGAVITVDKQIVSTGYNGTPKGITNCYEGGCARCMSFADSGAKLDECICVHAEENAIVQAACNGIGIKGGVLYTTYCPCSYCAKSIINAGIAEVVYNEPYVMDAVTRDLFRQAGVKFRDLKGETP